MEIYFTQDVILSFLTLTLLEVILGIDNIIFISILADKLPVEIQAKARKLGLFLAMFFRIVLLFSISWIVHLKFPLFHLGTHPITGRDLILLIGGIFLIVKTGKEIYHKVVGTLDAPVNMDPDKKLNGLTSAIVQIILIDIVFSFDSILTAIGLVDDVWIMVTAVIVSVGLMMLASATISNFVNRNPPIKMLALTFLVMIGGFLILEAFHIEFSKTYLYFAMFFCLVNEIFNMLSRRHMEKKSSSSNNS